MELPDNPANLFKTVGVAVVALSAFVLTIAVMTGDTEAVINWGIARIEGAVWLAVASALGLTAIFGSMAGVVLKLYAENA